MRCRQRSAASEADPGAVFAINCLGTALINLGRVEEVSRAVCLPQGNPASLKKSLRMHAGISARLRKPSTGIRDALFSTAPRTLAARLPGLMPLADRETLKSVARINLDIAELADDYAGIERWSAEIPLSVPSARCSGESRHEH